MTINLGNADRTIRVVLGVLALAMAFFGPFAGGGWQQWAAIAVAVIMIGTSSMKFCPLYRIFGIRTCSVN